MLGRLPGLRDEYNYPLRGVNAEGNVDRWANATPSGSMYSSDVLLAWIGLLIATLTALVGHTKEIARPKVVLNRSRLRTWLGTNYVPAALMSLALFGAVVSGVGIVSESTAKQSLQGKLENLALQNKALQHAIADVRSDNAKLRASIDIQSRRQLMPLEPISASYTLQYPCNAPQFKDYFRRLRSIRGDFVSIVEPGTVEYPNPTLTTEEVAYSILTSHSIQMMFLREVRHPSGRVGKAAGLVIETGKSPFRRPAIYGTLYIDIDDGCEQVEEHVIVDGPLSITPVRATPILTRIDLIDTEVVVSLSSSLPLETRLKELKLQFSGSLFAPVILQFDDTDRRVCCAGLEIHTYPDELSKVTYRQTLTARDLGIDLED